MRRFVIGTFIAVVLGTTERTFAADDVVLTKAPQASPVHDWNGFYVGPHLGFAAGGSNWSATQQGATTPSLAGSVDFFNTPDIFNGAGSYFLGLQAGYNYMLASRFLLGVEADASFPSVVGGGQTISSAIIGGANYADAALTFGTVRARVGYAPANWLFYATGGFAWSYDQLMRTQMTGIPVGGTFVPGTTESALLWRLGWTLGAGVEIPVSPHWTAKIEYLFTDFGISSVAFPAAAQRFGSDVSLHEMRAGLSYRFGGDATPWSDIVTAPTVPDADRLSIHGQTTFVEQAYPAFRSPYQGPNSLPGNSQGRETWDTTLYAGVQLWRGAELWIDPEVYQGFGRSTTRTELPDSPTERLIKSAPTTPTGACSEFSSGRQSISAARPRKWMPASINLPKARLPIGSSLGRKIRRCRRLR